MASAHALFEHMLKQRELLTYLSYILTHKPRISFAKFGTKIVGIGLYVCPAKRCTGLWSITLWVVTMTVHVMQ